MRKSLGQRQQEWDELARRAHALVRGTDATEPFQVRLADLEQDFTVAARTRLEGRDALLGLLVAELRDLVLTSELRRGVPAVAEHDLPEVVPEERL